MRFVRLALMVLLAAFPAALLAELQRGDLPSAGWYAHVDLTEMRSSAAGRELYAWLDREVFAELREEFDFDADEEVDVITALAAADGSMVVVVDGAFSTTTKDRILAIAAMAGNFNVLKHGGKDYYQVEETSEGRHRDSFEGAAFVSLAVKDKLLVTSSEAQMQEMLGNGGKMPGDYSTENALLVLRGARSFVQAGMQTQLVDADFGWNSNLLRNTEQVGLLVSDEDGALAVMAQLVATDPTVASSLASIVRGLISLQALSGELDAELSRFLTGTEVAVDGTTLTVKIALDPGVLIEAID